MQQFFPFLGGWTWWVIAGILLLIELMLPGVFFMWLALAAAVIGIVDIFADLSWQIEIAAFAILSVLFVLFVRPRLQMSPGNITNLNQRMYDYVGRAYVLDEPIVNGRGKIRIDDTLWVVTGADRSKGEWVKVTAIDGARLIVEPASGHST
jgi:membrane protein implicated in regulation of membrane protease activity